jgi:hypothetical protein
MFKEEFVKFFKLYPVIRVEETWKSQVQNVACYWSGLENVTFRMHVKLIYKLYI